MLLAAAVLAPAQEPVQSDVVFKSDVSLVRVDVQAVDRDNRAITTLNRQDFILRDDGKIREIRNFATEEMPLDIVFLLDVSASMRPHVERIANAAQNAIALLGKDDRIAIMVFDRASRVRTPFRNAATPSSANSQSPPSGTSRRHRHHPRVSMPSATSPAPPPRRPPRHRHPH